MLGSEQQICSRLNSDRAQESESMRSARQLGSRTHSVCRHCDMKAEENGKSPRHNEKPNLPSQNKDMRYTKDEEDVLRRWVPVLACRVSLPQACHNQRQGCVPRLAAMSSEFPSSSASTALNLPESKERGRHIGHTLFQDDFTTAGSILPSARNSLDQHFRNNSGEHSGTWPSQEVQRLRF